MLTLRRIALVLLFSLVGSANASAQDYPNASVRFVVPFASGGGVDVSARIVAQRLSEMTGKTFVVENQTGGGGLVGAAAVSSSEPDGYTLLYSSATNATLPILMPDATLNVVDDLTPITLVGISPSVLAVNPSIPVENPKELVEWIKANPTEFRWGIGNTGSRDHFDIGRFNAMAGISPDIIPYDGTGPAVVAAVSGEVSAVMSPPAALKAFLDAGQLKAIGVTTKDPTPTLPDVPPIASFGFPDFDAFTWMGIWGPKDMSAEDAETIRKVIANGLEDPTMVEQLNAAGLTVRASSSQEDFRTFFADQIATYTELGTMLGLGKK